MGGTGRGALSLEEVAARLRRIEHSRQVARAVRMVSLADRSSPTWVEEVEVRKEVDATYLRDWARSEFGDEVDAILIEFIEDVRDGIRDPDWDDGSLYAEWELAFDVLGHVATTKAVDFLERTGGYAFKTGADPESDVWFSARYAVRAMALVGGDRAREVLMAWFDAVNELWELDENILWELLPAVTPYLNANHVSKVLWLGSLRTQDVFKQVHRAISAHSELFRPLVIDGLRRRDPLVAGVLYPLFRGTTEPEEKRLLQEVHDDPAADSTLREGAGSVLDDAKPPPPQPRPIGREQISRWRSLAAEASDG